jgi:DNA-binding transcriptional regulator YiaG
MTIPEQDLVQWARVVLGEAPARAVPATVHVVANNAAADLVELRAHGDLRAANRFTEGVWHLGVEALHMPVVADRVPNNMRLLVDTRLRRLATDIALNASVMPGAGPALLDVLLQCARRVLGESGVAVVTQPAPARSPGGSSPTDAGFTQDIRSIEHALAVATEHLTARTAAETTLDEIRKTFALSPAELGALFHVSRQAIDQWYARGIPANRTADVERLADAARWLFEELKPERIPQIVRSHVPALNGRTMLELVDEEGPLALLEHLADLFTFQGVA